MSDATAVIDESKVEHSTQIALQQANEIVIRDQQTLEDAGDFLVRVKSVLKEINETFDTAIGTAHKAHREMLAAKAKHADPLKAAEETVKLAIGEYTEEQKRLARIEEQRRRDEIARQEQKAREEQAARDKKDHEEEEARLQEAENLEAEGRADEADAVLNAPPRPEPPIPTPRATLPIAPPPAPPVQAKGVAVGGKWMGRIIDESLLPRPFLMADEKKIKRQVSATGEDTKIPGVEVYWQTQVSGRAN